MFHHHEDHAPQTLVGISFDDRFRAQEFLTAAMGLAAHDKLVLKDAVTVVKDANGKTVVHETVDPQPGRSAMSGGLWAGLFGLLLGGPVGWIAGTALGAGAGAVTAHVVDLGVSDDWVAWFRDAVQPDSATVVLLVTAARPRRTRAGGRPLQRRGARLREPRPGNHRAHQGRARRHEPGAARHRSRRRCDGS